MKRQEKLLGYFLLIVSLILTIAYIFVFVGHIDFFANAKAGTATVIGHVESKKGDGIFLYLSYYNDYKIKNDTTKVLLKYSTIKTLFGDKVQGGTNIIYTKWQSQVFVKGFGEPAKTIFVLDFIAFGLLWLGIQAGISKIK